MINWESAYPTEINIVKISESLLMFFIGFIRWYSNIIVDHCNVEYPKFIASNKEVAPLKIGFLQNSDFSVIEKTIFI